MGLGHSDPALLEGIFVIRRLQADSKHSASGEEFKREYVWQSLKDWKTYAASELYGIGRIYTSDPFSTRSVGIYMGLYVLSGDDGNVPLVR